MTPNTQSHTEKAVERVRIDFFWGETWADTYKDNPYSAENALIAGHMDELIHRVNAEVVDGEQTHFGIITTQESVSTEAIEKLKQNVIIEIEKYLTNSAIKNIPDPTQTLISAVTLGDEPLTDDHSVDFIPKTPALHVDITNRNQCDFTLLESEIRGFIKEKSGKRVNVKKTKRGFNILLTTPTITRSEQQSISRYVSEKEDISLDLVESHFTTITSTQLPHPESTI